MWAIHREDLENFKRLRRSPGRPPKSAELPAQELEMRLRMMDERAAADTADLLRKPQRKNRGRKAGPT